MLLKEGTLAAAAHTCNKVRFPFKPRVGFVLLPKFYVVFALVLGSSLILSHNTLELP